MKITMKHIAKEAGISKATVSLVVNKNPGVSEATKKKVMEVINKYNYQPDFLARGLALNLSHTIGLLLPNFPQDVIDPFFLEFLQGVGNTAAKYDFSILLPAVKDVTECQLYKQGINLNQIDGLIMANPKINDIKVDYLKEKNIAFVYLGHSFFDQEIPWVDGDNFGGSCEAVKYLIGQGHKEIAYITGDLELVVSHLRMEGYQQALFESGIGLDSSLIEKGNFTWDSGYQAVKKLLAKNVFLQQYLQLMM